MSNSTEDPKIEYVAWRRGRPRFVPSKTLRDKGYEGEDLRHQDETWYSAGECLEWSIAFKRKLQLEQAATKKKAKPKKSAIATATAPIARAYPVEDLFQDWLKFERGRVITGDVTKKTVDNYEVGANAFARAAPDIWASEALALDKPICLGLYDKLRTGDVAQPPKAAPGERQEKPVKASAANALSIMRVLGMALEWGISRGKLRGMNGNPAHKLKMKTPEPRLRVASIEELAAYVATADEMGWPEMGDMAIYAVWGGQRQADRLASLNAGEDEGRMIFRQGKTGAIVSIPRAPELVQRLEAAARRRKRAGIKDPHVILCERRKEPFTAGYYTYVFEDIRAAASLKLPSIATLTDQDFRDTAVTWLARAGCTIPEICSITGHSFKTAAAILKHYLAVDEHLADAAIRKLIAWYDGQIAKKGKAA